MKIIGITACPTGIAHTYMAAEALEATAKELGHSIKIETQGSMGVENELTVSEIKEADVLILAVDMKINGIERFSGKPMLKIGVSEAIKNPTEIIKQAIELVKGGKPQQTAVTVADQTFETATGSKEHEENTKRKGLLGWLKI